MGELSFKLQEIGINKTPSIDEIIKLIQQHKQRQERGKQLALSRGPISDERRALLLYAKILKLI